MFPVLFTLGPVTIHTYGALLVVAFLAATWTASRIARRWPLGPAPLPPAAVTEWSSLAMLGGLLGGRLWYVVQFWEEFAPHPWEVLALWHGGLVWYGGFLGGVAATALFVWRRRFSLLRVLDQVIPSVVLGHGIGRIGCFLNGCCYGLPSAAWCAVTFPGHAEPRMPTQLLEAGALVLLAGWLRRWQRPEVLRYPGHLFGRYLVLYALIRCGLEELRGDPAVAFAGMRLAQLASVAALLIGLILLRTGFINPREPRCERQGAGGKERRRGRTGVPVRRGGVTRQTAPCRRNPPGWADRRRRAASCVVAIVLPATMASSSLLARLAVEPSAAAGIYETGSTVSSVGSVRRH